MDIDDKVWEDVARNASQVSAPEGAGQGDAPVPPPPPADDPEQAAPPADDQPAGDGTPPAVEDDQEPGAGDGFLDANGKLNWKAMEQQPWYAKATPEERRSIKATMVGYQGGIGRRNSAAHNEKDAEIRVLKAQLEERRAIQAGRGDAPAADPEAGPAPAKLSARMQRLVDAGQIDPDIAAEIEAAAEDKAKAAVAPVLESAEQARLVQSGEKAWQDAAAAWKIDAAHPVHLNVVDAVLGETMEKHPFMAQSAQDMIRAQRGPKDVIEYLYQTTLALRPDLRQKATPPATPAPQPAPGKAMAAPVAAGAGATASRGQAPAAQKVSAFIKACDAAL